MESSSDESFDTFVVSPMSSVTVDNSGVSWTGSTAGSWLLAGASCLSACRCAGAGSTSLEAALFFFERFRSQDLVEVEDNLLHKF